MRRTMSIGSSAAILALTLGLAAPAAQGAPADANERKAAKPAKVEINLKAKKPMVQKGKKVRLTGKVTPKKRVKGITLIVQQKIGSGKWKRTGATKVKKSGAFTWSEKPTTATRRNYRMVLKKSPAFKAAKSNKAPVAVAAWQPLNDMETSNSSRLFRGHTKVNDVLFKQSLITAWGQTTPTVAYAEVNLFGRCFRVRTAAALTDSSATGSSTVGRTKVDGVLLNTVALTQLGRSIAQSTDVTDAYRIRFELDLPALVDDDMPLSAAYLSPQFLCTR